MTIVITTTIVTTIAPKIPPITAPGSVLELLPPLLEIGSTV